MLIVNKDMFTSVKEYDAIAVTTNSVIKTNGELVMGAGIAKIFKNRYPTLPRDLGKKVATYGNMPFLIKIKGMNIISFPTKTHYKDKSEIDLIIESAKKIKNLTDKFYWTKVAIPAPGVGLGGLSWKDQVYPALSKILDDRFIIHFYNGK
tara:strand:- start:1538 stop:1987 length:450 start_codon:yes stop_codon:yes gene_type:complete